MGKRRLSRVKSNSNIAEKHNVVDDSNFVEVKQYSSNSSMVKSQFSNTDCPYDKLHCKRFDYLLNAGACFTYDVKGRLRFICKRFVAPAGFVVPKQLSSEDKGYIDDS